MVTEQLTFVLKPWEDYAAPATNKGARLLSANESGVDLHIFQSVLISSSSIESVPLEL